MSGQAQASTAQARPRRARKQQTDRHRRALRELERELQDRAERQAIPRRDEGPLPRID